MVLLSQVAAIGLAAILLVARNEPGPSVADLGWAVAAGIGAAAGILSLYWALAVGPMGVVAPLTAVVAAVVPAAFGILTQGLPGPGILGGIAVALVAVVLVARVPDVASATPRGPGVRLALLAGLGLGSFNVLISHVTLGAVFGPLLVVRVVEAGAVGLAVAIGRRAWRPPAGLVPAILVIGALDMAGNAFFVLAEQSGRLDIAAILSSLYPVTTIILAAAVLGERIARSHALGILLAGAAIVLIATG